MMERKRESSLKIRSTLALASTSQPQTDKVKAKGRSVARNCRRDKLLTKCAEAAKEEKQKTVVPGYCINDIIDQSQGNAFKEGAGVKYNINIISDNPDQITQVHSPRMDVADNSPTGSKKPNYLMKSIFCDCKSPSPKAKSSQKSPSQYLNISPIQQYFDLASRKKNDSFYEVKEKNKEMLSKSNEYSPVTKEEADDPKLNFNDFANNQFAFTKKHSGEIGSSNELDNSMNSGSNVSPKVNSYFIKGSNPAFQEANNMNDPKYNYIKKLSVPSNVYSANMPNMNNMQEPNYMAGNNTANASQSNIGPNYNFNIMVIKNNYDEPFVQPQNQYKKYYSMQPPIPQQPMPPYNLNPYNEKYLNLGYKPMNQNIFPEHQQQAQPQPQSNHLNVNNYSMNPKMKMMKNPYPMQSQQYQMMPNENPYQYQPQPVNPSPQFTMSNQIPNASPHKSMNQPQCFQSKASPNPMKPIQGDDSNSINQAYFLAKDQSGCRFLQKKVDEDPEKAIETIYPIILEHLIELTTEQFGNYLIQKFLDYLDEQRLIQFMGIISPYTNSIGINPYGTRVIQKLMDKITTEKLIDSFIIILTPNIISFIKDTNGIHIMQKLILMPNITFDFLFEIVCPNISELSIHRIGCCFVQKCFHAIKDHTLNYLLDEIIENTMTLVTNQYGNYVIQNVMLLNDAKRNKRIFDIMMSNFCVFSKHKFASNVIEKFCEYPELRELLIDRLLYPEAIKLLMFDNFGNYVLQKALSVANNEKRKQMLYLIAPLLDQLKIVNFGQKLYHKLIVQYPNLSTIMFSLKNSNRMNVYIGKRDMNSFSDN